MTATIQTPAYEVTWPDGSTYVNRYNEVTFTLAAAEQVSTRVGGTMRLADTETTKAA